MDRGGGSQCWSPSRVGSRARTDSRSADVGPLLAVLQGDGWTLRAARGSTTTSEEPACAPERSPSTSSALESTFGSGHRFPSVALIHRLAPMNSASGTFVNVARATLAGVEEISWERCRVSPPLCAPCSDGPVADQVRSVHDQCAERDG